MNKKLRDQVFPEPEIPDFRDVLNVGSQMGQTWGIGHSEFLAQHQCASESEYKQRMAAQGTVMKHAHMGFRDKAKSKRAFAEIYDKTQIKGVNVDRYGLCLDWSMGFPQSMRNQQLKGTGLILNSVEEFVEVANSAPVASHFGDFVLGFPGALENTQFALSAGSTVIGNLGQYFTFRLPGWIDDVETTRSTLTAIALMAAQPADVLVHSNLDDGFAAVFNDLSCALGAAMIEKYLIEDLMGGNVTHCFGHHYSNPLSRFAFQKALSRISNHPGSMIYGNTVSYRGNDAENYASLAGYLLVDIVGQLTTPSGHAINPVPVTENQRIPDIAEIIDAQLAGSKLIEAGHHLSPFFDMEEVDNQVDVLLEGGSTFFKRLLSGFEEGGIDTRNPFEMFLAIRRIGGKKLERWYGPGEWNEAEGRRNSLVISDVVTELDKLVGETLEMLRDYNSDQLKDCGVKLVIATTDVHEHSKLLLEGVFRGIGVTLIDGGVSTDPDALARIAEDNLADAIALTTYNGVALTYYGQLRDELTEKGIYIPILMGGQLNEIPDESDSSLPVDVETVLAEKGAIVCRKIHDAMAPLIEIAKQKKMSL
ncbi:MAG: hypothetical protein GKR96_06290 [Gammaproteobacteria bacterium]|nr:hypothetical protein [Gammaproteobacteria bacterium]